LPAPLTEEIELMMARIVKEEEYAIRRNEILDAAQKLIYTKGYNQMTIQDVLDELKISKGAFYHYFNSKQALLEALIERIQMEANEMLTPIVDDPHLSAMEKLQRYFDTASKWKMARKNLMIEIMRTWYADENALVRQKVLSESVQWIGPSLGKIVRQGIQEGVFDIPFPNQVGEILIAMFTNMGDTFAGALLKHTVSPQEVEQVVAAYTLALERVLGARTGSLVLIDQEALKKWVPDPPSN
jgi:AcrR family transcriptional regulator